MVTIDEIKKANAIENPSQENLVAVFVGATSGIGEGTLRAFAQHIQNPTVYIIGRSKPKASSLLSELRETNARGTFIFIEGDVSKLRECDRVCAEIKRQTPSINLLFQSQGYVSYSGREENPDGVDNSMGLRYYNRIRIMQNLLPYLCAPLSRCVSVLAGGKEGRPVLEDLDLKTHYSILNAASHTATMTTLSMARLAREFPKVTFVHAFPGLVSTNVFTKGSGPWVRFLMGWVFLPFISLFATTQGDAGERQFWNSTRELGAGEEKEVEGEGNMFTLDSYSNRTNGDLVQTLIKDGVQDAVWEFTQGVFKRARS